LHLGHRRLYTGELAPQKAAAEISRYSCIYIVYWLLLYIYRLLATPVYISFIGYSWLLVTRPASGSPCEAISYTQKEKAFERSAFIPCRSGLFPPKSLSSSSCSSRHGAPSGLNLTGPSCPHPTALSMLKGRAGYSLPLLSISGAPSQRHPTASWACLLRSLLNFLSAAASTAASSSS